MMDLRSLFFLFLFIGGGSAQDILPPGPVDAVLGKNVTLTTLLDKPEYVFIVWNFNDGTEQVHVATQTPTALKVSPPYQNRVSVDPSTGNLQLRALTADDSGGYNINVLSADGDTRTAEVELRVLEPVSNVVISSSVTEAVEGIGTVVLTCSAKGSFLKFSWLNGTTPIVADGKRVTLAETETSSALTFSSIYRSDLRGPVYCSTANKLETERSAPFNLTVYYGPEDVAISPVKPPPFVRSDATFNLTCSARSHPPAAFSWFRNQTQMEASGPVLTLKVVKEHGFGSQPGQYTCKATNAKTKGGVTSPAVSFAIMAPISGVQITAPTATLVAGNSSATLGCMAAAGTVTTRTWLKDGRPLAADARVVFTEDKSAVTIEPVNKDDNGEFTCQLANAVTTEKASHKMAVVFGPETPTVSGESAVEVSDPVTLRCAAASVPPATFTWRFNGTATAVTAAEYVIQEAVYKNTGTYTCEAHNAVTGKTSVHAHRLSVKEEGALDDGLSDGAIAGIVIAVLVALAAAIALIMYCRQKVPVESPY